MKWGDCMKFYTTVEVAEILKVAESTVSSWVKSGKLKAVKLGGTKTVRISEQALNDLLKECAM
jgi:excisionase family DNA binding protein